MEKATVIASLAVNVNPDLGGTPSFARRKGTTPKMSSCSIQGGFTGEEGRGERGGGLTTFSGAVRKG